MANYYDREDDRDREERRYGREETAGNRGQRYGGAYERDRGWEVGTKRGTERVGATITTAATARVTTPETNKAEVSRVDAIWAGVLQIFLRP
jgi:hypothetical protein